MHAGTYYTMHDKYSGASILTIIIELLRTINCICVLSIFPNKIPVSIMLVNYSYLAAVYWFKVVTGYTKCSYIYIIILL